MHGTRPGKTDLDVEEKTLDVVLDVIHTDSDLLGLQGELVLPLVLVKLLSMDTILDKEDRAVVEFAHLLDQLVLSPLHVVVLGRRRAIVAMFVAKEDDAVFDWDVERFRQLLIELCHSLLLWIHSDLGSLDAVRSCIVVIKTVFPLKGTQVEPVRIVLLEVAALLVLKLKVQGRSPVQLFHLKQGLLIVFEDTKSYLHDGIVGP